MGMEIVADNHKAIFIEGLNGGVGYDIMVKPYGVLTYRKLTCCTNIDILFFTVNLNEDKTKVYLHYVVDVVVKCAVLVYDTVFDGIVVLHKAVFIEILLGSVGNEIIVYPNSALANSKLTGGRNIDILGLAVNLDLDKT